MTLFLKVSNIKSMNERIKTILIILLIGVTICAGVAFFNLKLSEKKLFPEKISNVNDSVLIPITITNDNSDLSYLPNYENVKKLETGLHLSIKKTRELLFPRFSGKANKIDQIHIYITNKEYTANKYTLKSKTYLSSQSNLQDNVYAIYIGLGDKITLPTPYAQTNTFNFVLISQLLVNLSSVNNKEYFALAQKELAAQNIFITPDKINLLIAEHVQW